MAEVFCQKLSTIADLREIVEELARELTGEVLHVVMANFQRHCQTCLEARGRAFEYFFN